jgi:Tetratricopeptide repeat
MPNFARLIYRGIGKGTADRVAIQRRLVRQTGPRIIASSLRIFVMFGKLSFAIALLVSIVAGSVHADDALLEQLYGNGVHAYNQGDYRGAHDSLTAAIKGGTNDPRAYYFRGLAFLQLGRLPEATSDFKAGAELEVGDSLDVYPVNQSLERVQGRSRQILEQYRTVVHAAAIQRIEAERRVRYEQRAAAEQDVLRRIGPTELPPTGAAQPSGASSSPDASAAAPIEENPFSKPAADAVPESKTDDTKPSSRATPADEKNPFEAEPPKSEPAKPVPNSAPPSSDDPFGEPAPKAAPPANNHSAAPPSTAGKKSAAVQPTTGGLGSLFHAVASGLQSDKPAATAPNSAPVPDILRGILGNNQAPPTAQPPQQEPSVPVTGAEMPAAQPPAVTEQPQPSSPATQPANPAPQPSNPAEPPKNDDNPFN